MAKMHVIHVGLVYWMLVSVDQIEAMPVKTGSIYSRENSDPTDPNKGTRIPRSYNDYDIYRFKKFGRTAQNGMVKPRERSGKENEPYRSTTTSGGRRPYEFNRPYGNMATYEGTEPYTFNAATPCDDIRVYWATGPYRSDDKSYGGIEQYSSYRNGMFEGTRPYGYGKLRQYGDPREYGNVASDRPYANLQI